MLNTFFYQYLVRKKLKAPSINQMKSLSTFNETILRQENSWTFRKRLFERSTKGLTTYELNYQ